MKILDAGFLIVVVLLVFGTVGALSYKLLDTPHHCGEEEHKGHDAPLEEFCEDVIESQIGISLDLTPNSPEK